MARHRSRALFGALFVLAAAVILLSTVWMRSSAQSFTDLDRSMAPTIQPGQQVWMTLDRNVRRGDVVVFSQPQPDGPQLAVSRLIALPGDHVACCDHQGRVTVNGRPLDETYLNPDGPSPEHRFSVTVGPGQSWVMGDNRALPGGSRLLGPFSAVIDGRVVAVGSGRVTAVLRTPRTFVAEGLAPPDDRRIAYGRGPHLVKASLVTLAAAVAVVLSWLIVRLILGRRLRRGRLVGGAAR